MEQWNQSSRSRLYLPTGLLVLAVVSLVLQIIGLATPGWIVIYIRSFGFSINMSVGLWVVKLCLNGVCRTNTIKEFFSTYSTIYAYAIDSHLNEYRTETIIGVVSMLIVCVCLLYQTCCKPSNGRQWIKIYCVCSLVSAIPALVASGKLGHQLSKARNSPYLAPYSLIITGVGGILAAILFLIGLSHVFTRNDLRNQQQTVTMGTRPVQGGSHVVNQQIAGYPINMNTQSLPPPYELIAFSQGHQYPPNFANNGRENPSVTYHSDRPSHSVSDFRETRKHQAGVYHVQAINCFPLHNTDNSDTIN